jgi:biotin transport system substrate-specific component
VDALRKKQQNTRARECTVRNRTITSTAGAITRPWVHRRALSVSFVLAFAVLTAVGALVRIPLPFTPVPLTLQTFFVLLGAALLGARRGFASQVTYLGLGAAGLPIFAGGAASLALLGPTGGYLMGFAVASLLTGSLIRGSRGESFFWTAFAMGLGLGVIYLLGTVQLAILADVSVSTAISMGVAPFLCGDAVKLAAAAGIAVAVRRRFPS